MELVDQNLTIVSDLNGYDIIRLIESAGRTCYKSEWANEEGDIEKSKKFVKGILDRGHESVIEHVGLTVRFVTSRGVTHELVRHRIGVAYSQESTRFCDYTKPSKSYIEEPDSGVSHVKFIIPPWAKNLKPGIYGGMDDFDMLLDRSRIDVNEWQWCSAMLHSEFCYQSLVKNSLSPQHARGVLPIDLKTEIVTTANLREWRHIFNLRCSPKAHPQIRALMLGTLVQFYKEIPVIFDDLVEKYYEVDKEANTLVMKE